MALAYASNGIIISSTIFGARRASKAGHQLTSTRAGMLHGGLPIKMQQNNLNKNKKKTLKMYEDVGIADQQETR